ncbi:MAG: 23S rRNA (uracil(1939)-C(5))-methyltransferase RlmD [Elusimicrobiota bacterium]
MKQPWRGPRRAPFRPDARRTQPPSGPLETLTVKVQRMAAEGDAIALAEGSPRVVLVANAVPGDVLEVEVTEAKSSFARARVKSITTAGPERIEPPCPLHFSPGRPGPACGGCDWQQLKYEAQLKYKREIVLDCLRRIGKLKDVPVEETLASPQPWAYRNKVQIPFGPPRGTSKQPVAGFYATGSHQIVDFEACPVQPELSVKIALKLKTMAARFGWHAYEEDRRRGWLRHLYVRSNSQGKALAALVTAGPQLPKQDDFIAEMKASFPEVISLYQNVQPEQTSVILGPQWRHLWGAKGLEEKIGRFTFRSSPGAFLQINTPAAEKLYDSALAALKEGSKTFDLALDVYCGVGTLSLWVAAAARRVIGIEENRDAVRDAYKNAELNGVKNVRFSAGRAEAVLPRLLKESMPERCAVLVDPPRMGLSRAVLHCMTDRRIQRLVYVSCNPATFARDAAFLGQSGFALKTVQPVDLFPQTSHVECVGLFDRP